MKYIVYLLGVFLSAVFLSQSSPLRPLVFEISMAIRILARSGIREAAAVAMRSAPVRLPRVPYNRYYGLYDAAAVDLSESFIVWSLSPLYEGFDGCNGASYDYEELTGFVEHGVPLESAFPYVTTDPGSDKPPLGCATHRFQ